MPSSAKSSAAKPAKSSAAKPAKSSAAKPAKSSPAKPAKSSAAKPAKSSAAKPATAEKNLQPLILERNSNAVSAETDKIIGAAEAAMPADGGGLLLRFLIGLALAPLLRVLYAKLLPKFEEWKQLNAAMVELANPQMSAKKKGLALMD